jgi:hypothetical protein
LRIQRILSCFTSIFLTHISFYEKSIAMKKCLIWVCLAALPAFWACKKEKDTFPAEQEQLVQTEDNNDLKSEGDQANSDVLDAIENYGSIKGGRVATVTRKIICGCSVDSVGVKTIRLSYDGQTPCGNPSRTRSGTITFTLTEGNRWGNQGAKLAITFNNYKVTRLRDQKSWTMNGTKFLTNVRGTNWVALTLGLDSLLYRERASGMSVVIAKDGNSGTVNYNIARTTTWKYVVLPNRQFFQFAALGDTTLDGLANIDTWGTNRAGTAFTNQYLARLISDTYCLLWRPRSGTIRYKSAGNTATLNFGVNEQGQPDSRDCAYGWKVNWNLANGVSGEKIISY